MISLIEQTFAGAGLEAIETAWRPNILWREKRLPSAWATEERRIAAGQSPLSTGRVIPYSHELFPHCVEQMDSADDPNIRQIVIWEGIREGKTNAVCLNVFGRTVTDDPGNVYSVLPTDDDRDKFSNDDIEPMIDVCLDEYFVKKKSRDPGRTIGYKRFRGGSIRLVSARSVTKFRGTSVKLLMLHELDALDPESIYKAFGRTKGFGDAIIVLESTCTIAPTYNQDGQIEYHSNIHEAYDQGDKRKWFGPCRRCDALQFILYQQFAWPKGHMAKAVLLCNRCDAEHNEKQWRQFQRDARWFPTAGLSADQLQDIARHHGKARAIDPTVRSYWRNGFNSLLPTGKGYKSKLHEFVAEGESAKTSPKKLKTWKNEVAAELWDPSTEGEAPPPWKPIYDRREDYGLTVPAGGMFLTAFVDCQLNRLEIGWRAWGRNEESWGMDHVVMDGHVRDPEVWQMLRHELARKWQHESTAELSLGMAFVDGGHYAEDVYRFFQNLARNPVPGVNGHVRASKGVGQHGHPVVTRKMMTIAKNLKGHHIGTWEAKDRIYERLRMQNTSEMVGDAAALNEGGGPRNTDERTGDRSREIRVSDKEVSDAREGKTHFNRRFGEEYFQQLTVEQVTVTFERGLEIRKYVNPQQQRNEALDIEVGNLAAVRLYPRNFDTIEAELREQVKAKQQPAQTAERASRPREKRGWMSGMGKFRV